MTSETYVARVGKGIVHHCSEPPRGVTSEGRFQGALVIRRWRHVRGVPGAVGDMEMASGRSGWNSGRSREWFGTTRRGRALVCVGHDAAQTVLVRCRGDWKWRPIGTNGTYLFMCGVKTKEDPRTLIFFRKVPRFQSCADVSPFQTILPCYTECT